MLLISLFSAWVEQDSLKTVISGKQMENTHGCYSCSLTRLLFVIISVAKPSITILCNLWNLKAFLYFYYYPWVSWSHSTVHSSFLSKVRIAKLVEHTSQNIRVLSCIKNNEPFAACEYNIQVGQSKDIDFIQSIYIESCSGILMCVCLSSIVWIASCLQLLVFVRFSHA